MKHIQQAVHNFIQEDSGQDLIEYALVAALVGVGAIVALRLLSTDVNAAFTRLAKSFTSAT